jgi:hypothetical protein
MAKKAPAGDVFDRAIAQAAKGRFKKAKKPRGKVKGGGS